MQPHDKLKSKLTEKENYILALLFVGIGALLVAVFFDCYYDLNDDSAIKDILSGIYTGTPNGHNIQMLYALGALLALPYRILRSVPWFGLFLCACHVVCFYLIAVRSLTFCRKRSMKAVLLLTEGMVITAAYLWQLVYVQYTVVSGVLAVTAVFLFYTSEAEVTWKAFLRKNMISILLVLTAFALRTEMLLLLFPLICLTGLFKWSEEKKIFCKENFLKYGTVLGAMLVGMVLLLVTDRLAYTSPEWKEFRNFFDARTTVYDFTGIPAYEEHEEFYVNTGLSKEQHQLLMNYNFGLDERIDAQLLEQIADYGTEQKKLQKPFGVKLKESLYEYMYRIQNEPEKDAPWNLFVAGAYLLVLMTALTMRDGSCLWKLPMLIAFRSGLWLFILYKGRVVDRITVPLLMTEFIMLTGLLFMQYKKFRERENAETGKQTSGVMPFRGIQKAFARLLQYACVCIIAAMALGNMAGSVKKVSAEEARRTEVNTAYTALKEYCEAHPDNYYFFDVLSSVAYSEKMFENVNNSLTNFDLMGGWICKSPLYEEKLARFDINSMQEALVEADNTYILCRLDRPEADMEWLRAYYKESGSEVIVTKADTITAYGQDIFGVYTVEAVNAQ